MKKIEVPEEVQKKIDELVKKQPSPKNLRISTRTKELMLRTNY